MRWEAGSRAVLRARLQAGDTLYDPSVDVSLSVTDPSGTTTLYGYVAGDVTRESAGLYSVPVLLTEAGTWLYTWSTSGDVVRVASHRFVVTAPLVVVGSGSPP